jgi:hypothetical protein
VYGTAGSADKTEIAQRRDIAEHAADWSAPDLRLELNLRVVSDENVTQADIGSSNLVLFGNKETNRLIARFAEKLPLELNPGAADYGLVFVAPVDGHYVVVDSGLPFWTGADAANRPGFGFIGTTYRILESFPDYILFKGSLANVVAEGRFDRNWKVPAADAEKMRATGAVQVR